MINITFQFDSIAAAQEFLNTYGVRTPQEDVQPTYTETSAKKERKPRSDAGQPRGPYKRKEDESPVEAAAPAPVVTPPTAPVAAAVVPKGDMIVGAAEQLTLADVRAAMTGRSTEKNIALLKNFGYAKSSALPQAKYAEFIAACKRGE